MITLDVYFEVEKIKIVFVRGTYLLKNDIIAIILERRNTLNVSLTCFSRIHDLKIQVKRLSLLYNDNA